MLPSADRRKAFFLAVVGVLTVTGCARKQTAKLGEILVWHWLSDREDTLQRLADQYHHQTGVTVRLELYAPSDAYASKVRAAAQTSTLPDIFGVLGETRDLASFIKAGDVANLTSALGADNHSWSKQFFPKALATTSFAAGNQYGIPPGTYGIPIDVTDIQMLYNKELFKQVGLDPSHPPETWPAFLEAWHKLKAAGLPGFVSGWGETWMIDCFANNYAFNVMGEQKVLDTFRGKVPYTDPDWIRVLSLFDILRQEGLLVPGVVTMVNKTAEQIFSNGRASFAFNGSWCVNVYKSMNPDLSFGVMLPPRLSDRHPMRIWGGAGTSFMVNPRSVNLEASIRFLKWLTLPEQNALLSSETLNLPANPKSLGQIPETLAAFASRMDSTTHPSQWPVTENPLVTEALDKGIQSILIGEKTPQAVAREIQSLKESQSKK